MKKIILFMIVGFFMLSGINIVADNNLDNDSIINIASIDNQNLQIFSVSYKHNSDDFKGFGEDKE